ncbi:hypothetical protein BVRB_6g155390 [Beta vulgaris subsp. vulgaris]|uniref:Uncharacterized protein n=1 Tax=Beta vulgaris subsp. vulgaris TaxID=3555 RepID=A0A0J8BBM4_BETVV|nr:hypothetical protein BVRB_6g155390 [Beta vulgaris subsp. vulgaris]
MASSKAVFLLGIVIAILTLLISFEVSARHLVELESTSTNAPLEVPVSTSARLERRFPPDEPYFSPVVIGTPESGP